MVKWRYQAKAYAYGFEVVTRGRILERFFALHFSRIPEGSQPALLELVYSMLHGGTLNNGTCRVASR